MPSPSFFFSLAQIFVTQMNVELDTSKRLPRHMSTHLLRSPRLSSMGELEKVGAKFLAYLSNSFFERLICQHDTYKLIVFRVILVSTIYSEANKLLRQ